MRVSEGQGRARDADNWAVCSPKPPPAATTCFAHRKGRIELVVTTTPPGGTLYVGDRACGAVGRTPWRGKVAAGPVQLIVEYPGFVTIDTAFTVAPGKRKVSFPLVRTNIGTLEVRADADPHVAGASVIVDGELRGKVPLSVRITGGTRQVRIEQPGFEPFTQAVEIRDSLSATLLPVLRPVTVAKGKLVITSDVDGAEVFVDGQRRGIAPVVVAELATGNHVVEVKRGTLAWKQTVAVTTGQTLVQAPLAAQLPKTGTLRVHSKTAGARVFLDGKLLGAAPIERELAPGDHFIEVKAPGHAQRTERITATRGSLHELELDLERDVATTGKLRIFSSIDDAIVSVDGQRVGKAPVQLDLAPGAHAIVLERAGYQRFEARITIEVGKTQTLRAHLVK